MKIKILDLLSALQRHEALPIPTQARWGKLYYVLHILPISSSILTPVPPLGRRHK